MLHLKLILWIYWVFWMTKRHHVNEAMKVKCIRGFGKPKTVPTWQNTCAIHRIQKWCKLLATGAWTLRFSVDSLRFQNHGLQQQLLFCLFVIQHFDYFHCTAMMQVCCCWETVRLLMKQAHMQLFIKTKLNKAIHYAEEFDFFSLNSSRGWWLMIHCSHRRQKWLRWNSEIMISITRLKMMYVCHTLCSRLLWGNKQEKK